MKETILEGVGMFAGQAMAQAQAHIDANMESQRAAHKARVKLINDEAKEQIEVLKNSRKYEKISDKDRKKAVDSINKQKEKQKKKEDEALSAQLAKEFEKKQHMNAVSAIMDTASAIMKVTSQTGIAAPPWIAAYAALGAAQLAMIYSQKPPKAQFGGLVGGKSHAQGGTLIEAEAGEFIMNRDAVDSVGIETMNRMNTGGGGAINVSFSGNINSDDFIESEAIPKIREAIRRGEDIGIG